MTEVCLLLLSFFKFLELMYVHSYHSVNILHIHCTNSLHLPMKDDVQFKALVFFGFFGRIT